MPADHNPSKLTFYLRIDMLRLIFGQVVLDKKYTAFESDSYSTRWVTFPSSDFLDIMFQKALRDVSAQIARDPEVARHLRRKSCKELTLRTAQR